MRHEDVEKASQLINEMVDKGFSADGMTTELVMHLSLHDDLILGKLQNRFEGPKGLNGNWVNTSSADAGGLGYVVSLLGLLSNDNGQGLASC